MKLSIERVNCAGIIAQRPRSRRFPNQLKDMANCNRPGRSADILLWGTMAGGERETEQNCFALGCRVDAVHEGGDHWIVVGLVVSLHRSELPRPPLVFFGGRYSSLADEQTSSEEAGLLIAWTEPGK